MTTTRLSLGDWQSDAGLDKWIRALGITNAPVPRAQLKRALRWFFLHMSTLPAEMAANFLRAMDLSRPVLERTLRPPERLIAFRTGSESPFKLFYTRPGASMHASGINPAGREAVHFRVRAAAPALESYTTGAIDVWTIPESGQPTTVAPRANSTGVMAAGGGVQLIVPRARTFLVME